MPKIQYCYLCGEDSSTWPCSASWDSEHRIDSTSEARAAEPLDTPSDER